MIIEGNSRRNAKWFTTHIQRTDQGQVVSIADVRGLAGDSIRGWFIQMEAMALGTRGENYFYHANIDPRADEHMTEEQWEKAVDTLEHNLKLDGQPRFVVEHEKNGRTHRHVFWARADLNGDGLIRDSHNYDIHQRTADQLEKEFGHEKTPRGREPGKSKGPKNYEYFRGKAAKLTLEQVKAELDAAWRQADSLHAFAAAIAEQGYILCEGRRGLCVVDPAAKEHSLYKRLDLRKKELDPRMEAIDRDALPTVEEARATVRERLKGEDRDEAQPQPDHKKRDAALEIAAEEMAESVRKALKAKNKDNPADPEPSRADPAPGASGYPETQRHKAAGQEQPSPRAAAPYEPTAARRRAPSLFERLAEILSRAAESLGGGPTVAEAADLARGETPQPEDAAALPWQSPPHDPAPPAPVSTPSEFERLAQELARDVKGAAPVAGELAATAAIIPEPELSEFARLTQQHHAALAAEGEPGLFADGLAWLARRLPPAAAPPPGRELTPFEHVTAGIQEATRHHGGEPEPGFWQRGVSLLAAARDSVFAWAKERARSFTERIERDRDSRDRDNPGLER